MADKVNKSPENETRELRLVAAGSDHSSRLIILLLVLTCGLAGCSGSNTKAPSANPPEASVEPSSPVQENQPEATVQKPYLALALATYQQPDFAAGIRNNPPVNQSDLNNARKALADHQPADALEALQQAPAEYATDANYLRAHALFQLAQYPQSAVIFGKLRSSARYGEVAQWYELLAMLPYYERRKAFFMNRLKVIADEDGHIFQTEAKALLGKMVP